MQLFKIILLPLLATSTVGKMDFYIDEAIEVCVKPADAANRIDISQLELIATSDTEMVINGSVNILKHVEAPWKAYVFTEKFDRGHWNLYAYERRIDDFCSNIHKQTETWYQYTKDLKGCPLEPGVSKKFL